MGKYSNEYRGKAILITGGAGCIGSNLTKSLINAEAATIIILDDLSAAERWCIPDNPKVTFIQGSILDEEVLKQTFSQHLNFMETDIFIYSDLNDIGSVLRSCIEISERQ